MADLGTTLLGAAGVGGAIGKAVVFLELETKKYQAELKAAQAETAAATQSAGTAVSKYGTLAKYAFLGVGVAAVAGAAVAIKAASDLNEQVNKTKEVFEDQADGVLEWAKTTATGFGISETAALTAASSFGQILDAAGLAEAQTSTMSQSLVELAADLSSFNNIEPDVVLEKLQSGLSGMARPLREVGVFISEARVKTEAYTSGIADFGAELTDAQKIQARYNIILEDTTKAQGDFGRTVGTSIPNQMRVLKAEFEDMAAKLGKDLMPAVLDLMEAVKDLMPVFEALFKAIVDIVGIAGDFVHVITDPVAAIREGQETWRTQVTTLRDLEAQFKSGKITLVEFDDALRALRDETGFNTDVTDEYVALLHDQRQALELGATRGEYFQRTLEGVAGATDAATGKAVHFAHKTGEEFTKWAHTVKESFDTYVLSLEESEDMQADTAAGFKAAINDMLGDARDLSKAMKEISKEHWVNDDFIAFLSEQGPEWLIGFANSTETEQRRAQEAWEESTRKTDKAKDSLDRITGVLKDLDGGTSKHTVIIDYQYEGFDPSKPGMGDAQKQHQQI